MSPRADNDFINFDGFIMRFSNEQTRLLKQFFINNFKFRDNLFVSGQLRTLKEKKSHENIFFLFF